MKILRSKLKQIIEEEIDLYFNNILNEEGVTIEDAESAFEVVARNLLNADLSDADLRSAANRAISAAERAEESVEEEGADEEESGFAAFGS